MANEGNEIVGTVETSDIMLPPIDWKARHALGQRPEPRPSRLARLFDAFRQEHAITDEEVAQLTMKWSGGFW